MTTIYTTRAVVKTHLGITDDSENAQLDQWITQIDALIELNVTGYKLMSDSYTEYYSGHGRRDLVLNQRNVSAVASVKVDPTGYFGELGTAFGSTTLLVAGVDYALLKDDASATEVSACGILVNLRGGWPSMVNTDRGLLAGYPARQRGNIKVAYTAGFATVPADLQLAATMLVSELRRIAPFGAPASSFSLDYLSMSFANASGNMLDPMSIISKYTRWGWPM